MLSRAEPGDSRGWAAMFAPAIFPSEAEPALTAEFFKSDSSGFFVDIGANDPVLHSQSLVLEQRGWTGILVEPLPEKASELRSQHWRPRLLVVEDLAMNFVLHRYLKARGYAWFCRAGLNAWFAPSDTVPAISPFGRWQFFRKHYLSLPFRHAREIKRRIVGRPL